MEISTILRLISMLVMLFNMCMQNPQTRKACMSDWDVWLIPEIQRGWNIYRGHHTPYQEERDLLEERETSPD